MRSGRVDMDRPPTKRLVEFSQHRVQDDRVKNGTTAHGHGMSEEGESRNNEEENDGCIDLQAQTVLPAQQQSQHQLQGSYVQWERFLPFRSLQILLVETDDSTRHIVSALLQKCSYQVITAANGQEAWEKLEEFTNQIDIVLTEVVTPRLSGIGLLSKIMNHKTLKKIPVIMMSNNDSIGVVHKCLSKGAVDFLLKPIRKNELKILWQHVWRKCHCISWSDRDVEVDSPQPMSPWDYSANPPDNICAQVIDLRPEAQSGNCAPTNAARDCQLQNDESENNAMGKDLTIAVPTDLDLQIEGPRKGALGNTANIEKGSCSTSDVKQGKDNMENGPGEYHNERTKDKLQDKEIDLARAITSVTLPHGKFPNDPSKTNIIRERDIYKTKKPPSIELSLKRDRDLGDAGTITQERNVLRHSDHSAFSRYHTISTTNPAVVVGSCSPVDNNSGAAGTDSIQNLLSTSSGTPYQGSNGSSDNNDMGSTTNKVLNNSEVFPVRSSAVGTQPGSAFQPLQHGQSSLLQLMAPGKCDAENKTNVPASSTHHHHHYCHYHHHHHIHSSKQQKQMLNGENLSFRKIKTVEPQCGTSKVLIVEIEGDASNFLSDSGSKNGSNEQNGSSGQNESRAAVVVEGTLTSGNGGKGKSGVGGVVIGNGSCVEQDRSSHREAALNKFFKKRKERCFGKKVRYQSRQKLAEQRPRIRGQFVRQTTDVNKSQEISSNNPES